VYVYRKPSIRTRCRDVNLQSETAREAISLAVSAARLELVKLCQPELLQLAANDISKNANALGNLLVPGE
jgi:hypothetical protein